MKRTKQNINKLADITVTKHDVKFPEDQRRLTSQVYRYTYE